MLLVMALPDCALRLSKVLTEASYVVHVEDAKDLRHRIHQHQPDVVVLDWRMGGSGWRAIDEVPAIVSRTATHPHVIVVTPWASDSVDAQAEKLGCYEVVSVLDQGWDVDVSSSVQAAERDRRCRPLASVAAGRRSLH